MLIRLDFKKWEKKLSGKITCLERDFVTKAKQRMKLTTEVGKKLSVNKRSAGFILKSLDKYLVGHSTLQKDAKNIKQFDNNWTIFKGNIDENEDALSGIIKQ